MTFARMAWVVFCVFSAALPARAQEEGEPAEGETLPEQAPARPTFTTTRMTSPPPKTWEVRLGLLSGVRTLSPFEGSLMAAADLRYADVGGAGVGLALAADVLAVPTTANIFILGDVEAAAVGEWFRLTLYPAGTPRLRVGADPLVGFGGRLAQPATWRPVGVRGDLRLGALELWGAVQAAAVANLITSSQELSVSPLVGAAYQSHPSARIELRAAWFNRGTHPTLAVNRIYGPARAGAISARVELADGAGVEPIVDPWRYRRVAEFRDLVFERADADEAFGLRGELELVPSFQTALAPDEFATLQQVNGFAGVGRVTARWGGLRLQLTGSLESPASQWLDGPLDDVMGAFVQAADDSALAMRLDAAAERCFGTLCPGLFLRLERPAAVFHGSPFLGDPTPTSEWYVLGSQGEVTVLPAGVTPQPVLSASASVRWQPLSNAHIRGDLTYARDENRTFGASFEPIVGGANVFAIEMVLQIAL